MNPPGHDETLEELTGLLAPLGYSFTFTTDVMAIGCRMTLEIPNDRRFVAHGVTHQQARIRLLEDLRGVRVRSVEP